MAWSLTINHNADVILVTETTATELSNAEIVHLAGALERLRNHRLALGMPE